MVDELIRVLKEMLGVDSPSPDEDMVELLLRQEQKRIGRLRLRGWLELKLYDRNGNLKESRVIHNVITDVGKGRISGLINGVITTPFTYVAIGDGDASNPGSCTAASSSDTALGDEIARTSATTGQTTTSVTNDTATWDATFNFTADHSICEAGIFDASSGGNMLARQTFNVINVSNGDSLTISWKVQVQ